VAPEPCQGSNAAAVAVDGSDYKNWVNGNSNGSKSHWQEDEFISYRVEISGIPAGLNSIVADYKPVQSGLHAIDYLGSFDATETTSSTAAGFHYNKNNPCSDFVAAGTFAGTCHAGCSPGVDRDTGPESRWRFDDLRRARHVRRQPDPRRRQAVRSRGFDASELRLRQPPNDPQGTGACGTTFKITFTTPSSDRRRSQHRPRLGRPHREPDQLGPRELRFLHLGLPVPHGARPHQRHLVGRSGPRALVDGDLLHADHRDDCHGRRQRAGAGSAEHGATRNDCARHRDPDGCVAGCQRHGDLQPYNNLTCSGTPVTTQDVTVANAVVPPSSSFTPTQGDYSYQAVYQGDPQDLATTGECEPFIVGSSPTHW